MMMNGIPEDIRCVILAGGLGTRLGDETQLKPKPMVEIGGRPIIWHIMKHYSQFGVRDFIIALGYKGEVIKKYIVDYSILESDLVVDLRDGRIERPNTRALDWTVRLADTGMATQTGGRIKRLADYLSHGTFFLTWGDGVSDLDLAALYEFHKLHGRIATLTAVRPPARFGHIELDGNRVSEFSEKPQAREGWINGAFFVLEPEVFDYIDGDDTAFEHEPLTRLAEDGELMAFLHEGFWQCMDTPRDKQLLEQLWNGGAPPWKTWV